MKKNFTLIVSKIGIAFLLYSCNQEPTNQSFEDLLTEKPWKWVQCTKGNFDCYANQPVCKKDDFTTFFPEGGIRFEDTGIDCDSNPNNNIRVGNWEKINELQIKVNGVKWDILELTEKKLRIEYTVTGSPGVGGREVWVYEH
jgi:hypothetical protein